MNLNSISLIIRHRMWDESINVLIKTEVKEKEQ